MSAGKGDKVRPMDKKTYDKNFDQIQWKEKVEKESKKIKGNKIRYSY